MEFRQKEKLDWQEQFLRLKRWYYRIRDNVDGDKDDFYIAFFECCYHLKNWLVRDKITTKKEVEKYINQHEALKLCADICTFSKHAKITKYARTGDFNTEVLGRKISYMPPDGPSYVMSVFRITNNGKKLLRSCVISPLTSIA